jgi:outer membrane protein assembly factor BamB
MNKISGFICQEKTDQPGVGQTGSVNRAILPLLLLLLAAAAAAEWPQWRGPNRDGNAAGAARSAWPETLRQRWRIEVGEGHSSPVFGGGRICTFARRAGKEEVSAIDPTGGKVLWRQSYDAPYTMNPAARAHGEGPKSTPVLGGGRLCTFGISGILACWDGATGKQLWRKEFNRQYKSTSPLYGTAMSPVIDGGLLILHAGGHDSGALTALDAATGAEKWRWDGDGPGYGSPVIATLGGVKQVITQSQDNVIAVDAASGKLLWQIPLKTPYTQNSVTPLVAGGVVVLSGLEYGIAAVRPVRKGDAWTPERLWQASDVSLYMNSPVLHGTMLYGFSHRNRGQLFALDLNSGKVLWRGEPRQGENAALLLAGEHLLALQTDGSLTVFRATVKGLEQVRRYEVASSATWAHPVPVPGGILVKDFAHLTLWE